MLVNIVSLTTRCIQIQTSADGKKRPAASGGGTSDSGGSGSSIGTTIDWIATCYVSSSEEKAEGEERGEGREGEVSY